MAETWTAPALPAEPPMTVVRARDDSGDVTWWHVRPNQWYPASRFADRGFLAGLSPVQCDSWRYVLLANRTLTDDTRPGERPLNEEN